MKNFLKKWESFVVMLSNNGIPVLVLKDPKTKEPSITFSMLIVSFVICCLALIGKLSSSPTIQSIDFNNSFNLFLACAGLYWGRKLQTPTGSVETNSENADK